jgi:Fe-S cluster assembly protein SufD
VEAFKFTDVSRYVPAEPKRAEAADVADMLPAFDAAKASGRIVVANGAVDAAASRLDTLVDGLRVVSMREALENEPAILENRVGTLAIGEATATLAFNAALWTDGPVVLVDEGVQAERPLEVFYVLQGDGVAAHTRSLFVLGKGAGLQIVERHIVRGEGSLQHGVTEAFVPAGATLERFTVRERLESSSRLAETLVDVDGEGRFVDAGWGEGGPLSRDETRVRLNEPKAEAEFLGAYVLRDKAHLDNTVFVEHAAPDCESNQLFKGVISDRGRGVFQGKIRVPQAGQRTNAYQLNRALLLSERAEMNSKPELEIFADDVVCSHGASAGDLDKDALFYMRSRGVPETQARALLAEAFLGEVAEACPDAFQELMMEHVRSALGAL